MSDTLKINLEITSSNPAVPLGLEVWVDDRCITDTAHVSDLVVCKCEIEDSDAQHELRIVLKNKLPEHTKIDADGNIVEDAILTVKSVEFDEININDLVILKSQYSHSFNKQQEPIVDRFFGVLGCNGTVSLKFSTPFYLWLIDSM